MIYKRGFITPEGRHVWPDGTPNTDPVATSVIAQTGLVIGQDDGGGHHLCLGFGKETICNLTVHAWCDPVAMRGSVEICEDCWGKLNQPKEGPK
ncbi:MAG: hypothetical protein ABII76_25315 [Pseudomonadota bacterium]